MRIIRWNIKKILLKVTNLFIYDSLFISLFAADSQTSPSFDSFGVVVISLALFCDAIIGNVQEKAMKQFQATNNEVVFFSYAIACGYLIVITFSTGIMMDGYYYCSKVIKLHILNINKNLIIIFKNMLDRF